MARLNAIGPKRKPIAIGSTVHGVYASAWCQEYHPLLQELFRDVRQFGVAISGGVGKISLWVRLHHEVGY